MARKWIPSEERKYRNELQKLYVWENKTIREISEVLGIAEQTVFQRLQRLGIPSSPQKKTNYLRKRLDVRIPIRYSPEVAELFGVMLGDGHVSHFQVSVCLGNKEPEYAEYVRALVSNVFHAPAKISIRNTGYRTVYLGSTLATSWLFRKGLVMNKVKAQVCVPRWIFTKKKFMELFVRGLFDTDGSVYKIRHGIQISFTNYSLPLLNDLQRMLFILGYTPSEVSIHKVYLTKREEITRFFREIRPKNRKHQRRFEKFINAPVG